MPWGAQEIWLAWSCAVTNDTLELITTILIQVKKENIVDTRMLTDSIMRTARDGHHRVDDGDAANEQTRDMN